jgi:rod shape-determining protein MreC
MVFRVRQFAARHRDHLCLGCVIVISLWLMVLDQKPPVQIARKGFTDGFGFFQKSVSRIPRMITVYQDNKRLLDQLSRFSFREDQYNEMILENRRFRKLLGFKERNLFQFIPAEIVGRGTGSMPGSVYLNIGSEDGCRKNMVLVNDRGLVGKIVSVGQLTSIGQLISDPNFRVSAKTQRSRVLGIVKWHHGNICLLEGVSQRTDVQIGDLVVTSGYSQIYPAGIAIGRIFQILPDKEGLFLRILLKTEVDLDKIEEVFVLKNEDSDHR